MFQLEIATQPAQLFLGPKLDFNKGVDTFETDDNIGCIVVTGNEKAFAAGADIGFMKDFDHMHAYRTDFITRNWERIKTCLLYTSPSPRD